MKKIEINYNHKCQWLNCNIEDFDMLHIHHKNNDGSEDRKKLNIKSTSYRDIIKNNRYNEFIILCPNHHYKIHRG